MKDPEKQLFLVHAVRRQRHAGLGARARRAGVEIAVKLVVPLLLILLGALLVYAATTGGIGRALAQLFVPDFTRLGSAGILNAMTHALFTLGLGTGVMLMYGAYATAHTPLARVSLRVVALDTFTGLAAAVIIFSVLYAGGVEPVAGAALVFRRCRWPSITSRSAALPGTAFFLLLTLVAWVSALAFVEPALVWLGERHGLSRRRAALACGVAGWLLGVGVMLSFNAWAFSFKFFGVVKKLGMFDVLQILTAHLLLPLGGILLALVRRLGGAPGDQPRGARAALAVFVRRLAVVGTGRDPDIARDRDAQPSDRVRMTADPALGAGPYSAHEMFALVADIPSYPQFLPRWRGRRASCRRTRTR